MIENNITKGKVLKYTLLPQVFPRFKELISSGFGYLAFFMALVYRAANILPDHHPYLKTKSIGKFTIQNVLVEAAGNIVFNRQNIDKIIIFFALIAGIFILAAQFFILLVAIFVNPASAADAGGLPAIPGVTGFGDFFTTPNEEEDIALRMLDSVFGIPEIFGSNELPTGPTQFHQALHGLFQIYSFGLLVIAVIILIYFIFAILAETAQTGTPFGKRYNHVWAPIRLVVGIGLLVPMTMGINSAQWITLYAAKFGSGFATTGWIAFNTTLNDHALKTETLVATPKTPSMKDVSAFMMIAHACKYAYESKSSIGSAAAPGEGGGDNPGIEAWIINDDASTIPLNLETTRYNEAIDFTDGGDIYIRFGVHNPDYYTTDKSGVYPHCGDLVIQVTEQVKTEETTDSTGGTTTTAVITPSMQLSMAHFNNLKDMWLARKPAYVAMKDSAIEFTRRRIANGEAPDPAVSLQTDIEKTAEDHIDFWISITVDSSERQYEIDDTFAKWGWGSAALWYNQIANINGKLTTAAMSKPQIKAYPAPMTYTCEENKQQNNNTAPQECYDPSLSSDKQVQYLSKLDENVAAALSDMFKYWYQNPDSKTGNVFVDVVNAIMGTEGLFDMCENADIHPLAQLSALGKGLIEAAVRNLGLSLGSGAAGILAGFLGPVLSSASSFFASVASIGILIGFILFYIVPFMPFLYFLFAVSGWVKGLFEAMVGVPLWALAHLRIDGEGLPGDAAANGYFLIFEIFLRPILIIFGLVASVVIFGAMVKVLNQIFTLVVSNTGAFNTSNLAETVGTTGGGTAAGGTAAADAETACGGTRAIAQPGTIEWMRGPVDELFFTVIYAIMVYMIGMSCFKLIDLIPNNILRWMGQGLQTFNDQAGEPADGLLSKVAIGGGMLSQQLNIAGNLKKGVGDTATGIKKVIGG